MAEEPTEKGGLFKFSGYIAINVWRKITFVWSDSKIWCPFPTILPPKDRSGFSHIAIPLQISDLYAVLTRFNDSLNEQNWTCM